MSHEPPDEEFPIASICLTGGRLGLCPCPGLCRGRPAGTLAQDLTAIRAWGADILVSLTEADEMLGLGVARLGKTAEETGLAWAHMPIADFSTPDHDAMAIWRSHRDHWHDVLGHGGAIMLHCRGGLGRSGLVAALFLLEHGLGAEDAIAQVRAARPGAIETAGQEQWLRQQAAGLQMR